MLNCIKLSSFLGFLFVLPLCACLRACAFVVVPQEYLTFQEDEMNPECFKRSGKRCFSRQVTDWLNQEDEGGWPHLSLCVSRIWMMCRTHKQPSFFSLLSLGHLKGAIRLGFNCQLACRYINADTVWHKSRDCLAVPPFKHLFCLQSCV